MKMIFGFVVLFTSLAQAQVNEHYHYTYQLQTNFVSGQRQLSDEAAWAVKQRIREELELYISALKEGGVRVEQGQLQVLAANVQSWSDVRGDAAANQVVSQERADALSMMLQAEFRSLNLQFDPFSILAIGLGEMDEDPNSCRQPAPVQQFCSLPKKSVLPEAPSGMLAQWMRKVGQWILPVSHAQRKQTLFDLLFGQPQQAPPRPVYQAPPPPSRFDSPWMTEQEMQNRFSQQQNQSCQPQSVWDENCLNAQRIALVEITYGFKVAAPAEQPVVPAEEVGIEQVVPSTEPVPAQAQPQTPSAPVEEPVRTPPAPLRVYGQPVGG